MDPNVQPRDYQIADLGFHIANPKSLNLSDPGTGKTPTACWLAWYHWSKHGNRTWWTMPKSLMKKNKRELLRFTDFTDKDVVILDTDHRKIKKNDPGNIPVKERLKRVKQKTGRLNPDGSPEYELIDVPEYVVDMIALHDEAKVFITTFKFGANHWQHMLETIPSIQLLMVDEIHMGYGGPKSAQTESFYYINQHCPNMMAMTGTLVDGRLDSAFPAIHVIEPRYYGGYSGFIREHAGWINDYNKVEYWINEDKVRQILERHAVRHSFEEVYGDEPVWFGGPNGTIKPVLIEMGPEMRKAYDDFHEQAMLELENGDIISGAMPGVATIRATQIMSHPETMGIAKGEIPGKDQKLAEYAVEGRPLLVFAALQAEQRRCKAVLEAEGLRVGLINADVGAKERNRIDEAFCAGELDAIVGSGPTVAVGYNWERADHVVFVSVDYKDTNAIQAYRRASRGTRTTVLRVTFLEYEDSIDRRKFDILAEKSVLANRVDPSRKVLEFTR
jgi:hypothetical protein